MTDEKKLNRLLAGRKIVEVRTRVWGKTNAGTAACDPELVLDDGTRITFHAQETDLGDYGVELLVEPPKEKRRAK